MSQLSSRDKISVFLSIPLIFALGTFFHYAYQLTGNNYYIGLLVPVNESIWEHMKLSFLPTVLWWTLYRTLPRGEKSTGTDIWFCCGALSAIVSTIAVPSLYYLYTGALGVESAWFNVVILLISVVIGQLMGLHYLIYGKGINYIIPVFVIMLILFMFAVFTVSPPDLPIFIPPPM